jgi:hypothetical protein
LNEDYKQAAALAQARKAVGDTDAMAGVLKDLQAALEEERFEDAAAARDSGAGLLGWWAGVEVPCGDEVPPPVDLAVTPLAGRRVKAAAAAPPVVLDPRGCLLRVTAAYGRVEGRPHPATAITEIHANVPPSERLAAVEMLTSMQAPVMAMHVQRDGQGYRTQAVVLCPSTGGASPFSGGAQSEDEGEDGGEGGGTVVFDDVIRSPRGPRGGAGGGPSVRIHIVVEPRSSSSEAGDDDSDVSSSAQAAELTNLWQGLTQQLNDSADDSQAGNGRSGSANSSSSDEDDADADVALPTPPTPRRRGGRGGSSAVFVVGQDPQDKAGDGGGAMLHKGLSLDQGDGGSTSLANHPQRVPASLSWTGRHTFSLSYVPPPPAGSAAATRGGPTQVAAPPRRRRGRPPKSAALVAPAETALAVDGDAAVEATSGEGASTGDAPQPGSLMDIVLKKWAAIAQEVARLESKPTGASPSGRAALVAAVRDASQTTLAAHGMDMSLGNGVKARVTLTLNRDGSSSNSKRGGAAALAAQQQQLQRPRKWAFTRLDPSYASGSCVDPFTALYVGSFGSHGPEMLQLVRGRWGDEPPSLDAPGDPNDYVTAVKLTGDHNVPAGRASFKAFVGPGSRLDHHGVYPDELPVLARYKGFGRAARPGFADPQWVDGELLVLDGGAKDITNGAELGFVWEVPGEKRFLILLGRVRLPVDVIGGL